MDKIHTLVDFWNPPTCLFIKFKKDYDEIQIFNDVINRFILNQLISNSN